MALNVSAIGREFFKAVRRTVTRKPSSLSACDTAFRQLHLSANSHEKDNDRKSKGKRKAGPIKERQVSEEMKTAARDVAQSLGGNWTKTAEELLSRLVSHQEPPTSTPVPDEGKTAAPSRSLLNTMAIGRSFKDVRDERQGGDERRGSGAPRTFRPMRRETFNSIFDGTRLGIFDAESVKAELQKTDQAQPDDLWHRVDQENLRRHQNSLHNNAFEEMAQQTRAGKMWKFPVDNEEDMHEERKYQFYDHIFLDKHLGEFPDQGPIRKFMELVVIGLGSNPWLSVPEKIGHIEWYADYFREKEDILVASIGEQGKMKPKANDGAEAR